MLQRLKNFIMDTCIPLEPDMENRSIIFNNEIVQVYKDDMDLGTYIFMNETIYGCIWEPKYPYRTEKRVSEIRDGKKCNIIYPHTLPKYWNWKIPLLVKFYDRWRIISKHGGSYIDKSDKILQTMIIPCPYTIGSISYTFGPNKDSIQHIGSNYPIVLSSINTSCMYNVIRTSVLSKRIYGILDTRREDPHHMVFHSTIGYIQVWVYKNHKGYYAISLDEHLYSVRALWLYGKIIYYNPCESLEELLWNIHGYIHVGFTCIPGIYTDIAILC